MAAVIIARACDVFTALFTETPDELDVPRPNFCVHHIAPFAAVVEELDDVQVAAVAS